MAYLKEIGRGADPRLRVLPFPEPFNYSALNNRAVREAHGEVIGVLNNDVEGIAPGWLAEMGGHAPPPRDRGRRRHALLPAQHRAARRGHPGPGRRRRAPV